MLKGVKNYKEINKISININMTIKYRLGSIGIISIIYIYSSKIGKDIWNAKIECRENMIREKT
jgi:hypothetical protein